MYTKTQTHNGKLALSLAFPLEWNHFKRNETIVQEAAIVLFSSRMCCHEPLFACFLVTSVSWLDFLIRILRVDDDFDMNQRRVCWISGWWPAEIDANPVNHNKQTKWKRNKGRPDVRFGSPCVRVCLFIKTHRIKHVKKKRGKIAGNATWTASGGWTR